MIENQIEKLLRMKNGWLNGYGKAPEHQGLLWLQERFLSYYEPALPPPNIVPTIFGSVQLEWCFFYKSISASVSFKSYTCSFHMLDSFSNQMLSIDLDLNNPNAWKTICKHVASASAKE